MDEFKRYAVYYAPPPGDFADMAAAWLGWDCVAGRTVAQPDLGPSLANLTSGPRRYGFHGTIKAPFRLAEGITRGDLSAALAACCAGAAPVTLPGLHLAQIGGFMALIPQGDPERDMTALTDLAARVVRDLEPCRAPLTAGETARRRPHLLTRRQRELLTAYGYPYVLDQFRFHLTLSNCATDAAALRAHAETLFLPLLPRPFVIDNLCLFGEAEGWFHLLERHALTG